MNLVVSLIIGLLFASSVYLMTNRSFFKLILGVIMFGYATIFFLFVASGVKRNQPPLLADVENPESLADPLPQAFTLTAIVIGIGIQLFVVALMKKAFEFVETDNLDSLNDSDQMKNGEERGGENKRSARC